MLTCYNCHLTSYLDFSESLEGSPRKSKKKKLLIFRRKKHKREKSSNTVSVEKGELSYLVDCKLLSFF